MMRTWLFILNSEMKMDIDSEIWRKVYNLVDESAYEVLERKDTYTLPLMLGAAYLIESIFKTTSMFINYQ